MSNFKTFVPLAVLAIGFASAQEVSGQGFANAQVNQLRNSTNASAFSADRLRQRVAARDVGRFGVAGVNSRSYGPSQSKKPFQGLNRGPAVSPYLALSGSLNGVSDYYNVVQPQREFERARQKQERENQRAQRAIMANQQRLEQIAARPPFDISGDRTTVPTGHSTTYQLYSNFGNTGNFFTPTVGLNKQNR